MGGAGGDVEMAEAQVGAGAGPEADSAADGQDPQVQGGVGVQGAVTVGTGAEGGEEEGVRAGDGGAGEAGLGAAAAETAAAAAEAGEAGEAGEGAGVGEGAQERERESGGKGSNDAGASGRASGLGGAMDEAAAMSGPGAPFQPVMEELPGQQQARGGHTHVAAVHVCVFACLCACAVCASLFLSCHTRQLYDKHTNLLRAHFIIFVYLCVFVFELVRLTHVCFGVSVFAVF